MDEKRPFVPYNKCADMFWTDGAYSKLAWLQPAGQSTLTTEECEDLVPRICNAVNTVPELVGLLEATEPLLVLLLAKMNGAAEVANTLAAIRAAIDKAKT